MDGRIPLSTLLSYALVAFTIEFDNEYEHQMPHRLTNSPKVGESRTGPWLVSMVMWLNCLRFANDEGMTVGQVQKLAKTTTNWHGMQRWRYVIVEPDPNDKRPKPPVRDWLVRPTRAGLRAQSILVGLGEKIEDRWQERFGQHNVLSLKDSLWVILDEIALDLPDCMPILGYGLSLTGHEFKKRSGDELTDQTLPGLLSRALLAFELEFEMESELSLPICSNVLRVVPDEGVAVHRMPALSSVSKESIAMAIGFLQKRSFAVLESVNGKKWLTLTQKGLDARDQYERLVREIEARWSRRFGNDSVESLRQSLEKIVVTTGTDSPLFTGLVPYPDGWRAAVPKPNGLPHFPMVLHRGGYPDGA